MHTYLKIQNGEYKVGLWLINRDHYHQFNMLFTVPTLEQALIAVNALNGGTLQGRLALNMKEEPE